MSCRSPPRSEAAVWRPILLTSRAKPRSASARRTSRCAKWSSSWSAFLRRRRRSECCAALWSDALDLKECSLGLAISWRTSCTSLASDASGFERRPLSSAISWPTSCASWTSVCTAWRSALSTAPRACTTGLASMPSSCCTAFSTSSVTCRILFPATASRTRPAAYLAKAPRSPWGELASAAARALARPPAEVPSCWRCQLFPPAWDSWRIA
mmetsp:Transcript_29949/g.94446  ORF Transcript_29949/g.94446 Transcript_29949/m.94446 type:complete len:212 (+) Transcript_29949:88-723(+)